MLLKDAAETEALGAEIGARLAPGDVVALRGGLGAGKTTLARGLIRALCGPETETPSPTFTLLQTYEASVAGRRLDLHHFDLYRLADPDEVHELGWEEIGAGAALVEWPERAGANLPMGRLDVDLEVSDAGASGEGRVARLSTPAGDPGGWKGRLDGL